MTNNELRPEEVDQVVAFSEELREITQGMCDLFGISGLATEVVPGGGWSVTKTDYGLTLMIDPLQLVESVYLQQGITPDRERILANIVTTDRDYVKHTVAHELGHAKDMLDDAHGVMREAYTTPSERFFWNILDDSVIDTRLRTIPALDAVTDDLYNNVLFPGQDYRESPKNEQLMYGLAKKSVTGVQPVVSSEVQAIIDELSTIQTGDGIYDIMKVLRDDSTSLDDRVELAKNFIKPHYFSLVGKDAEEGLEPEERHAQSMGLGYGDQCCAHHYGDGEGGEGHGQPSIAQAVANALSEYYGLGSQGQGNFDGDDTELVGRKLEIDPTYRSEIEKQATEIHKAARAFLTLAVPSKIVTSPRYTNTAHLRGGRLHSKHLARAAIQMASETEQPIWMQAEQLRKRQVLQLDKLDIRILVDESGSMGGFPAQQAGIAFVTLAEGLQLAKHWVAKDMPEYTKPDVRLQVQTFGTQHSVVVPLSASPSLEDRQKALGVIKKAAGGSTIVNGALKSIQSDAKLMPKRQQLVLVISDGGIHDYVAAKKTVESMPRNVHVVEFCVGGYSYVPITKHYSQIVNAETLQKELQGQFRNFVYAMNG